MSTHSKSKLYLLIIGILLITNIAMLIFFFTHKNNESKNNRHNKDIVTKEFLESEIGFSKQQLQQYDSLKQQNKEKMELSFDNLKAAKQQQLKQLGINGFSDSAIKFVMEQSVQNQKDIEVQMLNYFISIRKLCTANQQPKFDSLFYKILNKKN